MEDQQSAAGDLTGDHPDQASRVPVGKARRRLTLPDPVSDGESVDGEADTAAEVEPQVLAERKPAGRWAPAVVGAAAALFVGSAAFAGATVQPYLSNRAVVDTKVDIARTAAEAITTLWTYTPENRESLADRSARFLGGDFEAQYRKYVDAIAPTNKQAQVTNSTEVVGAAVESLHGSDATAIVYTNSTATSPLTKGIPSLRYLSYRLTLEREAATWLVTSMNTITSLDLTPQI
ncbi:Mce associated membrane protein [soil metagenome]